MKIVLRKDIDNLGKWGDILVVKDGYARNYLIPRGLALEATEKNLRIIEREKREAIKQKEEEKKNALTLAERIKNSSCTIAVEVGEDGRMFGAVTNQDIARAYAELGISLDKRMIELNEPLKELGIFYVPIKLHPEVSVEAKVWVVKK
ncbi:MAG: 50S ribosomal protein L9 [Candidatus Omnitrophica bacterium]|nr:50S ribosomal protein L9 [Candidatus Omnitrophota bacterium]MCM8798197.1 50S ribosomal protein L9 [Candidatus Omnitrophota bacterium]